MAAAAAASCARFVAGAVAGGRTTHVRECEVDVYLPGAGIEAELFGGNLPGYGGHAVDVDGRERLEGTERGDMVRLHLIDTPGLDTSSPVALDRSLADVLRVIEARFEESLEDVRHFILLFFWSFFSIYPRFVFTPVYCVFFLPRIVSNVCVQPTLFYMRLKIRSEVYTD